MIRLYGNFSGQHSLARVTEGFCSVFPDAARYSLSQWENDLDETPPQPGATARVGLFVGNVGQITHAYRAKHERLYVMVAPNSDTVGTLLRRQLDSVDVLLTPSKWAQRILQKEFPWKRAMVARHGVDSAYKPVETTRLKEAPFSVLHLSSSTLSRKGTDKLLEGWALAGLPNSVLYLSVAPGQSQLYSELADALGIDNVRITDRVNLSPGKMAGVYASMDFVCQPSRGEAFGLVPLEARCCGTPVIVTDCTGHSEHVEGPGTVYVRTGNLEPIDDFPGAFGPALTGDAVAEALTIAYRDRALLKEKAVAHVDWLRNHWSWENQLKELKNELYREFHE